MTYFILYKHQHKETLCSTPGELVKIQYNFLRLRAVLSMVWLAITILLQNPFHLKSKRLLLNKVVKASMKKKYKSSTSLKRLRILYLQWSMLSMNHKCCTENLEETHQEKITSILFWKRGVHLENQIEKTLKNWQIVAFKGFKDHLFQLVFKTMILSKSIKLLERHFKGKERYVQ